MFYLTTCDDGQILTSHHRDLADLLDCTKSFMRAAMRDDPAFDELLLRHNAEAATAGLLRGVGNGFYGNKNSSTYGGIAFCHSVYTERNEA